MDEREESKQSPENKNQAQKSTPTTASPLTWGINSVFRILWKLVLIIAGWVRAFLDAIISPERKAAIYTTIFKTETPQGRRFDTIIIFTIIASIVVVVLETVNEYEKSYSWIFFTLEWVFTITFTIEYILRLYTARNPIKYARSFYGIVDLLAILPSYFGVFIPVGQNLLVVRALRLLRVFRILKMGHFVREGEIILAALKASRAKVYVFIYFVILISVIIGSMLYIVEGGVNENLDNIPKGIYWSIVTLTTVGYGDVTPITPFGKFLATVVMVLGYGVIAVPTGIVTAEINKEVRKRNVGDIQCSVCGETKHLPNARFCHSCGASLDQAGS